MNPVDSLRSPLHSVRELLGMKLQLVLAPELETTLVLWLGVMMDAKKKKMSTSERAYLKVIWRVHLREIPTEILLVESKGFLKYA
eukprot:11825293-Ditylum_brightwellii.AAC.1